MQAIPLGRGVNYPRKSYDKRTYDKYRNISYEKLLNLKYIENLKSIINGNSFERNDVDPCFDTRGDRDAHLSWKWEFEEDGSDVSEKKVFPREDPKSRYRRTAFYNRRKDVRSHYVENFGNKNYEMAFFEKLSQMNGKEKLDIVDEMNLTEMLEKGIDIDIVEESNEATNVKSVEEDVFKEKTDPFTEFLKQKSCKEEEAKETEQNEDEEKEQKSKGFKVNFAALFDRRGSKVEKKGSEEVEEDKEQEEKTKELKVNLGSKAEKKDKKARKKSVEVKESEGLPSVIKKAGELPSILKEMSESQSKLNGAEEPFGETYDQEEMEASKIDDETSVTYISKDKMFLITGTKKGHVNIWAFLDPYPPANLKRVDDYIKEKRRFSLGGGKGILEVEEQEKTEEEQEVEYAEDNFEYKRPEGLGWSELYRNPDFSFMAHEAEVNSVQITPKRFSKTQVDYIIVTTSKDKTVKVWKLLNLVKGIKQKQKQKSQKGTSKKEESEINVEMIGCLSEEECVDAVFIPNTSKQIIVAKESGMIEKYELNSAKKITKESNKTNMTLKKQVQGDESWTIGSISTSCDYYAVGGRTGIVNIFDVKNLDLIGAYTCRNRRGSYRKGQKVTGLEWNKKDNLLLVTTLDSRIRLLSFTSVTKKTLGLEVGLNLKGKDKEKEKQKEEIETEEMRLEFVEKFKGHINKKKGFQSRFVGTNEQLVICPSEKGQLFVWEILNDPSRRQEEGGSVEEEKGVKVVKNAYSIAVKVEDKQLLERINIFNRQEWDKLVEVLVKSKEREAWEQEKRGCLSFKKPIKNKNIDPINNMLIVTSENGWRLKYTILDARHFE